MENAGKDHMSHDRILNTCLKSQTLTHTHGGEISIWNVIDSTYIKKESNATQLPNGYYNNIEYMDIGSR